MQIKLSTPSSGMGILFFWTQHLQLISHRSETSRLNILWDLTTTHSRTDRSNMVPWPTNYNANPTAYSHKAFLAIQPVKTHFLYSSYSAALKSQLLSLSDDRNKMRILSASGTHTHTHTHTYIKTRPTNWSDVLIQAITSSDPSMDIPIIKYILRKFYGR